MQVRVNDTTLFVDVEGAAVVSDGPRMAARPTILLLHGGPGGYDHTYFKPDFSRLAKIAQVVYVDLRDHGRSARHDSAAWTFEACADDIRALCDTLGIERPIVLGHSMGGFIALHYAIRHPGHAGGLVLQSTTARFHVPRVVEGLRRAGGDAAADAADRFYNGDMSAAPEFRERCRPLFGPWILGEDERARIIVNEALVEPGFALMRSFDVVKDLGGIDYPVLVSVGELEPVTQVEDAREMIAALPKTHTQLDIIPGAGHFPWKDVPDHYWPVLERFIQERA